MAETLKADTAKIVVVGDFNPAIFQPEWFRRHSLLRDAEIDAATDSDELILSRRLVNFETDWLEFQVTPQRLFAKARRPSHFRPLRDLVAGILQVADDTPIVFMGLVRMLVRGLDSREEWHRIEDTLVPKEMWTDSLEDPGMLSLEIAGVPPSERAAREVVKLTPFGDDEDVGLSFEVRVEYLAEELKQAIETGETAAGLFSKIITDDWSEVSSHADSLVADILDKIPGDEP